MTYKNTKTILFASLIVAMILPFSGMQFVDATHVDGHDTEDGSQQPWDSNGTHGTGDQGTAAGGNQPANSTAVDITHPQGYTEGASYGPGEIVEAVNGNDPEWDVLDAGHRPYTANGTHFPVVITDELNRIIFSGMQSVNAIHIGNGTHVPDETHLPNNATLNGNPGENLSTVDLQVLIDISQASIAQLEVLVISDVSFYEYSIDSIIAYQVILAGLDAIVSNGGTLTNDQIVLYNDSVYQIIWLEHWSVVTAERISIFSERIALLQATIVWAQAEIDSRTAST